MQIGRRYMERVAQTHDYGGLDVQDILRVMQPKLAKKEELQHQIAMLEKEVSEQKLLREKEMVEMQYQDEKAKLDKAHTMGVLTDSEYIERVRQARKRADCFDEIRRINQQYDMNLISAADRDFMISTLLNG